MPKMSKDGVKFFDVDDSDESVGAAKAKGYKEYVPMTKNGKDVFNVEFSEESYKAAVDKGYKDADRFAFENKGRDAGDEGEAAMRGGAQGLTLGFADELTGVAGAIVNPTDSDKGFVDRYRDSRDYARGADAASAKKNPGSFGTGALAGGIATGVLIPGSSTLGGSAAMGAAGGLGSSEADLTDPSVENLEQAAIDTAFGAGTGVLAHGAAKGAQKGVTAAAPYVASGARAVGRGAQNVLQTIKTATRGAGVGAKAAAEGVEHVPGISTAAKVWGSVKGAINEVSETAEAKRELASAADDARSVLGNAKDLSDDEAIVAALLADGDNPTKRWVAQKAATMQPGQIDQDAYAKVLALGSDARTAAREFDPRSAAGRLKPAVEDVQTLFKDARSSRYGQLQDAARSGFKADDAAPALAELDSAIQDAATLKSIPGSVRGVLDDVSGIVFEGKGTKLQKLTPGMWGEVDGGEQFNRFQAARKLLDDQIKWSNREGHTQAESILRGLRDSFDDALKTSPDKVEADKLYRASKDVEGKFFGATEFRNATGGIDVDEGKIARLLGNTDQGNRFRDAMADLQKFADDPELAPEFRKRAADLIKKLEAEMGTAENKRAVSALRYANGPSSPAIERMASASRGNGLVQDAVSAPGGAVASIDQLNKTIRQRFGKSFAALSEEEKNDAVRFVVWMRSNPDASEAAANKAFAKIRSLKPIFREAEEWTEGMPDRRRTPR